MRSRLLPLLLALAAVWIIVGGITWWTRSHKPTPESLTRYLSEHPLEYATPAQRARIVEKAGNQLNELNFEQRREMRMGRKLDGFFRQLTPEEQGAFLDRTLPAGFREMMESFNKMEPAKRKQFVERALRDMEQEAENPRGDEPRPDDPNTQRIVNEGLKSFYNDASAEVKMDFAPLIEQMQKNLQGR